MAYQVHFLFLSLQQCEIGKDESHSMKVIQGNFMIKWKSNLELFSQLNTRPAVISEEYFSKAAAWSVFYSNPYEKWSRHERLWQGSIGPENGTIATWDEPVAKDLLANTATVF